MSEHSKTLSLTRFLNDIGIAYLGHDAGFSGISVDTRILKPGDIFFDVTGNTDHIQCAVEHGACAIVSTLKQQHVEGIPFIHVDNGRLAFAKACAVFYPNQPKHLAAITGTNGKTSTVDFIRQLWASLKLPAISYGTLGLEGTHTTIDLPKGINTLDAYHYHQLLHDIASYNPDTFFAFEASSHGLDQHRIDGVTVKYAAFTNLTQDHLDYHETMDQYFQAKARLFLDILDSNGMAIINKDDTYGDELVRLCKEKRLSVFTYSLEDTSAHLYGCVEAIHANSMTVYLRAFDMSLTVDIPVVGHFQIANILAAIGILLASHPCRLEDLKPGLENLKSPRGRMEHVGTSEKGGDVFVDYAHTPDALKRALQSLRAHTSSKLSVVFGCGGDRDRTKRPLMGQIATEWADHVIITDDNPRTENAVDIRAQVLMGTTEALDIGGRENAIVRAIQILKKGDVLLIAGKGHEQGQIIGDVIHPFCDKDIARKYLGPLDVSQHVIQEPFLRDNLRENQLNDTASIINTFVNS
ncbi:MAG: UDP-N-acetylmuramoyl-L-alanyl-D-glutamate--2,6-diaminopimelate ligase [Alphaproteobacteria bacterium]|nr:UDP-N-acetylmuramoyl-L-alanyl-D-glutamate--2,6-diaminopimelate ligase [Alphaproteobacteria bacterium]